MDWLDLAKTAFEGSTTYFDANLRKQQEDNFAHFQGRHAADSKYYLDSWKYRSKSFVPKTRSIVRKGEATVAAAFFSNVDVVTADAQDQSNTFQVANAALMKELLNYRLQKSIPWFATLIGAFQEAEVCGVVCSYQDWMHRTETETVLQAGTDEFGNLVQYETQQEIVVEDRPYIDLVPLENVRFDPGADWRDPVGTSPYFIHMVPMYVGDVKDRMKRADPKTGQPVWTPLEDGEIQAAMVEYDSVRNARENQRTDSKAEDNAYSDFDIVWCHRNFIKVEGKEYFYWTLGTQHLLSEPVPIKEAYWTGERPYVIGTVALEAHKAVPASLVELGSAVQKELNDIRNSRMDNVKLVLNKRWLVRRNKNVDIASLNRNVPGSVTLADDIADIQEVNWPDVTASAYQEQDRLNVDFDELLGNFSGSSVMTNRKLNETVGGMSMLNGSASVMTEYAIRTFVETWVEPVLRQLVKLEAKYETDEIVLGVAGGKAQLQRYGVDRITDDLLNQDVTIYVNVGMGATDPNSKLQKFSMAAQTVAGIAQALPGANMEEVRKEVFGLAGYRDGSRFFPEAQEGPSPELMQAQQMIQQLQQALQQAMDQRQMEAAKLQLEAQKAQEKAALDAARLQQDEQKAVLSAQIDQQAKASTIEAQRQAEAEKAQAAIQIAAMEAEIQAQTELQKAALQAAAQIEIAKINADAKEDASEDMTETEDDGPKSSDLMQAILATQANLLKAISAPKRVVRGSDGRVAGVESA